MRYSAEKLIKNLGKIKQQQQQTRTKMIENKLSENFTLTELTISQTAVRKGIDNKPNSKNIKQLAALAETVLQPLREALGRPIIITSGYRSPELNKLIGGSKFSQHCDGQAVDFIVTGVDEKEIVKTILSMNLPFDQLIYEGQWVHVSHSDEPRGETLSAVFKNGKATYMKF